MPRERSPRGLPANGPALKALRRKSGHQIQSISRAANVQPRTLQRAEQGLRIDRITLERIARFYQVALDAMTTEEDLPRSADPTDGGQLARLSRLTGASNARELFQRARTIRLSLETDVNEDEAVLVNTAIMHLREIRDYALGFDDTIAFEDHVLSTGKLNDTISALAAREISLYTTEYDEYQIGRFKLEPEDGRRVQGSAWIVLLKKKLDLRFKRDARPSVIDTFAPFYSEEGGYSFFQNRWGPLLPIRSRPSRLQDRLISDFPDRVSSLIKVKIPDLDDVEYFGASSQWPLPESHS